MARMYSRLSGRSFVDKKFGKYIEAMENVVKENAVLLSIVFLLVIIGLCWVSSTTQLKHIKGLHSPLLFSYMAFIKQFIAGIIGIVAMFIISVSDLKKLKDIRKATVLYFFICLLLIATLFTKPILGSRRWIQLGFFNLQTSEFAKIAIIIFTASFVCSRKRLEDMKTNTFTVFYPFCLAAIGMGLIAAEPDIGIPALIFVSICCMLYASGVSLLNLFRVAICSIVLFALDAKLNLGHRLGRIQAFCLSLAGDKVDVQGDAFQIVNSLVGICSGKLFGRGIGESHQKTHLLSQGDSDFIFSVFAEETGLLGSLLLIGLFTVLVFLCFRITVKAKDPFYRALGAGFSSMLALQIFYSISVNINLVPVKGIALPFISNGGCSLISTLMIMGIILNISMTKEN